ncbi:hypothetical protein HG15A2_00710 [Adhaeretor mobilis]|uniref:Uncharacterized protein n=1 Tax=Adhaeretor mobilis TaxID=1930276 RepID=A0A517MPK2_9BACT|nr:hypothetical protein HG15A2_00710 [Adhaeretor mobilis]
MSIDRPYGTKIYFSNFPSNKLLGYYHKPLRGKTNQQSVGHLDLVIGHSTEQI